MQINISIPAWGQYYVDLACRFTIPSILVSLAESNFDKVKFLIHTDDPNSFRSVIKEHSIEFLSLPNLPPRPLKVGSLPSEYWAAFKKAHKDAIAVTNLGQVLVLLNSDIVVSRECFAYVEQKINAGYKVVASVGIRTQIEDNPGPPIGVAAPELFKWIWGHRHHITDECIWNSGRSQHPTILFFEDGNDLSMHCFHLTPMFILKDRDLRFSGTIDDDLLGIYRDSEVAYPLDGEVAFAELSPTWKTHPFGNPLTVDRVAEFWSKRAIRLHYVRNFRQRLTILGAPTQNHPIADKIITSLTQNGSNNSVRSTPVVTRQSAIPANYNRLGNQDFAEFSKFTEFCCNHNVRKYLEIGCRNGDSFNGIMRAIGNGARGVAVDLPENDDSRAKLQETVAGLRSSGMVVDLIFGDVSTPLVIERIKSLQPFDLILIDADHRYESIRRDFENFINFAPLVALHDVSAPLGHMSDGYPNGVGVFWKEIKNRYRHVEFITPGSNMGFGIIIK